MKSVILARAAVFALAIISVAAHGANFRAGAGKSEIQVTPDMLPLEGLASQHDPLTVRVLLMDDGKTRSAILVLEQPSVSEGTVASIKAMLTKLAGVSPADSIIVGTHTTSAPHAGIGGAGGPGRQPGGGPGRQPGGGQAVLEEDLALETQVRAVLRLEMQDLLAAQARGRAQSPLPRLLTMRRNMPSRRPTRPCSQLR